MGIQINGITDTISATDGGLAVSGQQLTGVTDINASGIVTATQVNVGTGVTLHSTNGIQVGGNTVHSSGLTINQINISGVATASSFVSSGTNLLTEINTKTSTGKAIAMSMIFGS